MTDDKGHAILEAQTVEECIIDQNWSKYTAQDHGTWKTLYNRQIENLKGHVC